MTTDSLRKLVEARDRNQARPNRLEPERLVLAPRRAPRSRRICIACREPINEFEEHQKFNVAALVYCGCRLAGGICHSIHKCPRCGGSLVEITD